MALRSLDRSGIASRVSVAVMIVILAVAASASYFAFSQGTTGPFTTSSTPAVTTYHPTGSTGSSSDSSQPPATSTSSAPSSSGQTPSSSSSGSSNQATSSSGSRDLSKVQVIIPPGIENLANKISFEPLNITVRIGVNNTVFFTNNDDQEHILESTSWPTGGQPFQLYSLPNSGNTCVTTGTTMNCITLTTPGKYTYFCEWHPIWMDGTINVVA